MSKHYKDPPNKPSLFKCGYEDRAKTEVHYRIRRTWRKQKFIHAVQIPENNITGEPSYVLFYGSMHSAKQTLAMHNSPGVTRLNQGNRRKARYLQYTVEEMGDFLFQSLMKEISLE